MGALIIVQGEGADDAINELQRRYRCLLLDDCPCMCDICEIIEEDDPDKKAAAYIWNGNNLLPKCIERHLKSKGIPVFNVGWDGGTSEIIGYICTALLSTTKFF